MPHMKAHYVCRGGCGGVSEEPGTCRKETCTRYRAPLEKCECEDGRHHLFQDAEIERGTAES